MNVLERSVQSYMPTEAPVWAVTDVDFARWVAEGVKYVLLDVEACLGETGSEILVPEYIGAVEEAREAGIQGVGLWTNKTIDGQDDYRLVSAWGEQVAADIVLSPLSGSERKPSPVNAHKAMRFFDATPDQMGVVDDKASAGVRGGYFAGFEHRAWTRPFGKNRHPGDRLFRDPLEAAVRVQAHLMHTPKLGEQSKSVAFAEALALFEETGNPEYMDNILGFGMPNIELDQETLDKIKTPAYRKALNELKGIKDHYSEAPAEQLKAFFHEHGRRTADILTNSRLMMAAALVATNTGDLDATTKDKINAAVVVLAPITDFWDGKAARGHKHGATTKGAADDQNIDKMLSAATDLFVLLPKGSITTLDLLVSNGRDFGMTALRKPFKDRGIDTKSITSGKVAMAAKNGAQIFGTTLAHRYPKTNEVLQHTATGLKVASMLHGPQVWIAQHERQQHLDHNLKRYLASLAINGPSS